MVINAKAITVGSGIVIVKGTNRLVITDDAITVCCNQLAISLMKQRLEFDGEINKVEVQTVRQSFPRQHRVSIRSLSNNRLIITNESEIMTTLQFYIRAIQESEELQAYSTFA